MSMYVYTTTGTHPYLRTYLHDHPERTMTLMQRADSSGTYLLMDESNANSIFNAPFGYINRYQYQEKPPIGMAVLQHIGLLPEDEKSFLLQFDKLKATLTNHPELDCLYLLKSERKMAYLIMTFWQSTDDFHKFEKSIDFQPLLPYVADHQSQSSEITYADVFYIR
ncbi:antibiotic biosynthesis monooxygenase [Carnobacterium divergens]|uniref:Antibiotic biosynthesis monooxygenase n=1 Tax=Carnobacterium divergens TaxID=2748 RepID=A0AAW8RDH0_CARDV|nr:antibiotic biosynthesis monooxygenase [Carnobacterium divergens]MDT1958419.1 antibiotic biosynthesis monooxygenase [Carnobacterium divergens]MDT1974268.1 antibiotic biosynthesis monooxygenase [Carnobacterium divergens]